jgi:hypothetical protein
LTRRLQLPVQAPWPRILRHGTDIDEIHALALAAGATSRLVHARGDDPLSAHGSAEAPGAAEARFRAVISAACRRSSGVFLAMSFSRAALYQTGDGHFSPLGGYHAGSDSVLVLEAAKFKYPPHWIPVPLMWAAMQRTDWVTNRPRGYLVVGAPHAPPLEVAG